MIEVEGYCVDIEANGFYFQADKIWTIWLKDLNDPNKKLKLNPFKQEDAYQQFKTWNDGYNNPVVTGHFILGYDCFVLFKILGVEFTVGKDTIFGKPCQFIDTLYLSQVMFPDANGGHSLEAWGERLGKSKIDYFQIAKDNNIIPKDAKKGDEFLVYDVLMDEYCERDVDVNILVFWKLWKIFCSWYSFNKDELPAHYKCGQKSFYLMSCQEYTGWRFDLKLAEELVPKIEAMMKEIEDNVLPRLPPRELKKGEQSDYTMPAKPFKQDGTLSSHMEKFIAKHNGVYDGFLVEFYGKTYPIAPKTMLDIKVPMEIKDGDELKAWFVEQGWKPTMWNFKRGKDGKPERDSKGNLTKTSPKIQEAGKICPNLESLDGELPKQIVKFLSLRNRLSVLTGWMENWRINFDGRIGASRTGITPTQRQKHSVLVNVPKASDKVLLGKEFRSLWICEEGNLIAAGDAAALEGRVQGHYTWKYDKGETARELLDGDIHSKTAKSVYADELEEFDIKSPTFSKDDSKFKPYRDRSKNIYYAIMYGAGDAKVASTAAVAESRGKEISEKFWAANKGTKDLKDALEKFWNSTGEKKWLLGIDGRRLQTRKKSALLNTLFQSCGAIAMDYACCYLDAWLGGIKYDEMFRPYYLYKGFIVRRVGYFHDECEFECQEEIAQEVAELIEKAIAQAGKHLKLNVPLVGEGKVGKSWKEVH